MRSKDNFEEELEKMLIEESKSVCPECLKCGWCCSHTVCYYGEWNYERNRCKYLNDNMLCGKYEEIVKYEKSMGVEVGLFGSGCCYNYSNPWRRGKEEKEWKQKG